MTPYETAQPSLTESVLNIHPDAMIWVKPIFDKEEEVIDFEVLYANNAANVGINHPKGKLIGLRILQDGIPSLESAPGNFRHFLEVYQKGELMEYTFYAHHSNRLYETIRQPHAGGVLSITRDRGAQREAERREQATRNTLESIVQNSPSGIALFDSERDEEGVIVDFKIRHYNQRRLELLELTDEEGRTLTLRQLLRQLNAEQFFHLYVDVAETGTTLYREQFVERSQRWLSVSTVKMDGGVLVLLTDINAIKQSQQALTEQSAFLNSILDSSLSAVFTCEAIRDEKGIIVDLRYTKINEMYRKMIGKTDEEVIGKTMLELFPTAKPSGAFDIHCRVIETGISARFDLRYQGEGLDSWFDISSVRVDENRVAVTFMDVLEQKTAALRIQEQKELLDNILRNSSNGISVSEMIRDNNRNIVDCRTIMANEAAIRYTGLPREIYLTKTANEVEPGLVNSPYFRMCMETLETGKPFITQYMMETTGRWLELTVSRMDSEHLIHIFTDITPIKEAQLQVEKAANMLKTVFNAAQVGMFTFKPEYDTVGELVDFRFVMVNSTLSGYVGQQPETLEGALGSEWFPGYLTNGVFDMYKETFLTGDPQRKNVYYNVDGHDIYLDLQCVKVDGYVLVTFTDHSVLSKSQLQLEQTVRALERSNKNLEDFAHAASHDMKEPLRKIRTFIDRIKRSLGSKLEETEAKLFERIDASAERMQMLVDDLLEFSHVSEQPRQMENVNLNDKVLRVLTDLELPVEEKQANIIIGDLPNVKGNRRQLQQLLQNLIGNALKYSKPDIPPKITIQSRTVKGHDVPIPLPIEWGERNFHLIEFTDNGIGFEQEYADRIFEMFQRLHGKSEYAGTGVGLSIARKVVDNHNGYIWAKGQPGIGATFYVLLPVS
jgi:signal transduction histidine kinase